jgi:hypothetical protein
LGTWEKVKVGNLEKDKSWELAKKIKVGKLEKR